MKIYLFFKNKFFFQKYVIFAQQIKIKDKKYKIIKN